MFGSKSSNKPKEYAEEDIGTILGEDAYMKGELICKGSVRVNGRFEGVIKSEGLVIVGENGCVQGDIEAMCVNILGEVKGNVCGNERVEIASTGRLFGDVATPTLGIAGGAIFVGTSKMPLPPDKKTLASVDESDMDVNESE